MGRRVVVTGGFGVLGSAVAAWFAGRGDLVTRLDFAACASETLDGALDLGGVDLADEGATRMALERHLAERGELDVLVNVAGGFVWQPLEDGAADTWLRMQGMNLLTTVTITRLALPHLLARPGARIVSVGAGAAVKAGAGMGAYAASKAGVHRLTEALAEELAGRDITVNAVLPSIIDTPANRRDMPDADFAGWVSPAALADVIGFLASPAARAISGALVPVTRGG